MILLKYRAYGWDDTQRDWWMTDIVYNSQWIKYQFLLTVYDPEEGRTEPPTSIDMPVTWVTEP